MHSLLDLYIPINTAEPDETPKITLIMVSQSVWTGSTKNDSIITTKPTIIEPSRRSMQQQY